MARPIEQQQRIYKKKKKGNQISIWEMWVFIWGRSRVDETCDVDHAKRNLFPKFRDEFLDWWYSDLDVPPFCNDFKNYPVEHRRKYGKPFIEKWHESQK